MSLTEQAAGGHTDGEVNLRDTVYIIDEDLEPISAFDLGLAAATYTCGEVFAPGTCPILRQVLSSKRNMKEPTKKMEADVGCKDKVDVSEILWSWIGSFMGLSIISYINFHVLEGSDLVMLTGSFGATAVLVFAAIKSPLAQPRNLMGGHLISAVIGVAVYQMNLTLWLASSVAVATAIAAMQATKTLHPPGGAVALIAVIGSDKIHELGYTYVFFPAGLGALVMLVVALFVNNIPKTRTYPQRWY